MLSVHHKCIILNQYPLRIQAYKIIFETKTKIRKNINLLTTFIDSHDYEIR